MYSNFLVKKNVTLFANDLNSFYIWLFLLLIKVCYCLVSVSVYIICFYLVWTTVGFNGMKF